MSKIISFKPLSSGRDYSTLGLNYKMKSEYEIYKKYLDCNGDVGDYIEAVMRENGWEKCDIDNDEYVSYTKTLRNFDYNYEVEVAIAQTREHMSNMGNYGVHWVEILKNDGSYEGRLLGTLYDLNKYKYLIERVMEHLISQGIPIDDDSSNDLGSRPFMQSYTFKEQYAQIYSILEMDEHYCLDNFSEILKDRMESDDSYSGLSKKEAYDKLCQEWAKDIHENRNGYVTKLRRTLVRIEKYSGGYREEWCDIANKVMKHYRVLRDERFKKIKEGNEE